MKSLVFNKPKKYNKKYYSWVEGKCSNCGYKNNGEETNYCPNCGKKMS